MCYVLDIKREDKKDSNRVREEDKKTVIE
jgi:hypothetical protein